MIDEGKADHDDCGLWSGPKVAQWLVTFRTLTAKIGARSARLGCARRHRVVEARTMFKRLVALQHDVWLLTEE